MNGTMFVMWVISLCDSVNVAVNGCNEETRNTIASMMSAFKPEQFYQLADAFRL